MNGRDGFWRRWTSSTSASPRTDPRSVTCTRLALTAIARELAGFLWAAARTVDGLPVPIRPDPKATPTAKAKPAKARTPVPHPRTTREYVLRPDKRFSKTPAAKTRT